VAKNNGRGTISEEDIKGLTYPCEFPLKMFGKNDPAFVPAVDGVILKYVPKPDWISSKQNISSNGNYLSYTVVIRARTRLQLDEVCAAVTVCPSVLMAI
jgi:putative lipoic acid-binding regulatory protein|tara:strand:- start:9503 stop:9799 length:297 start_codon:yes stop_codon:yes gene_type:complete